jgi:hypothetical protein
MDGILFAHITALSANMAFEKILHTLTIILYQKEGEASVK